MLKLALPGERVVGDCQLHLPQALDLVSEPRGLFELKYFFGSHVSTDSGGACSATAIRALLRQLIGAEDGKKPLSDSQLSEILGQQGIVVARRTVAKYRESLNIPPVNLRKTL